MFEARNIKRSFGGVKAVNDVSLDVEKGSIVGLIGTNGAGKTTLFNVVSGYLQADSGSARMDGEEILGVPPYRISEKGIVRSFQTPIGFPKMTVLENMLVFSREQRPSVWEAIFGRRSSGSITQDESDRVERMLKLFGLGAQRDVWVQDLGAADLKLLEFARTMMADPKLLMLDEPAAGVNVSLLGTLTDTIFRLRDEGVTFLIVDHNLGFISQVCDRIYAMADGKVISEGGPNDVLNDPAVIECYIGSATVNS